MTGHELFEAIRSGLGPEAHRHRGIDAPARRDTAMAGGSYRAPGALVDGFRAGDADVQVTGIVVAARASTAVLRAAKARGSNIVISRQAFLGDSQDRPVATPERALAKKLEFIEKNGLAVLRLQDPRVGRAGRAIAEALPASLNLRCARSDVNLADGLVYSMAEMTVLDVVRKLKTVLSTPVVRLVGDPALRLSGIAFATETSRPNALAPLIARDDVQLVIAGEVHETETTAYVLDAIAIGRAKALLLVGSIAMEEPAARLLANWLSAVVEKPVTYLPAPLALDGID